MNPSTHPAPSLRSLQSGHTLMPAGQRGPVWRVLRGVLRLERRGQDGQALDMMCLRSGPIRQRVAYLLTLLDKDNDGRLRPSSSEELPTLREMAQIVDSALETVCRELIALLPHSPRDRKPVKTASAQQRSPWVQPAATAMALSA